MAIAVLMGGAALYTGTRELVLTRVRPYGAVDFSQVLQGAMRCPRAAHAKRSMNIHRVIVIPAPPAPPVSVSTD